MKAPEKKLSASQERTLRWIAAHHGRVSLEGDRLYATFPEPGTSRYAAKSDSAVPALHMLINGELLVTQERYLEITDKGRRILQALDRLGAMRIGKASSLQARA